MNTEQEDLVHNEKKWFKPLAKKSTKGMFNNYKAILAIVAVSLTKNLRFHIAVVVVLSMEV